MQNVVVITFPLLMQGEYLGRLQRFTLFVAFSNSVDCHYVSSYPMAICLYLKSLSTEQYYVANRGRFLHRRSANLFENETKFWHDSESSAGGPPRATTSVTSTQ